MQYTHIGKETIELWFSFFDFFGLTVEERVLKLRANKLAKFSIYSTMDFRQFYEGSDERFMALYLAVNQTWRGIQTVRVLH